MNYRTTLLTSILLASSVNAYAAPIASAYTITDLGAGVVNGSSWMAINNAGQVAGANNINGVQHATIYTNGNVEVLESFGGNQTSATDINDNGQVTGFSQTLYGTERAFLYSNDTMQDIGSSNVNALSMGFGINNSGQITGFNDGYAFLYENGSIKNLGALDGGSSSAGTAINNVGQITGYSTTAINGQENAFIYTDGTMMDIGTLGGRYANPLAINDNGFVTGYSMIDGNATNHAFLYSNGVMQDLGALGGVASIGYDINTDGQVVGVVDKNTDGVFSQVGFIYSEEDGMIDLNSLMPSNSEFDVFTGRGINDSGQILVEAYGRDGMRHALILTSVPIPSAIWLFGSGLLGLVAAARRRS